MSLSLAEQARMKCENLRQALDKYDITIPNITWIDSPQRFGYRNRIRLKVTPEGKLAFFNPNKCRDCAVLEPRLIEAQQHLYEYTSPILTGIEYIELRSPGIDHRPAICVTPREPWNDEQKATLRYRLPEFLLGFRGDSDIPLQHRALTDTLVHWVPLDGFLQINTGVNRLLVESIVTGAQERKVTTALDLFSGSGNFSLPLAQAGSQTLAIESHVTSAQALSGAAREQKLDCIAQNQDAREACIALRSEKRHFDLVLIDAPRAGAGHTGIIATQLTTRYLALVSCNTVTLARDLGLLKAEGFYPQEILLFDMFPHTRYVETLVWLERGQSSA